MQLNKAIGGRNRRIKLTGFVIRVSGFELRLLGITAEWEAGLEFFKIFNGCFVVAAIQRTLGFFIEMFGGPFGRFVFVFGRGGASYDDKAAQRNAKHTG